MRVINYLNNLCNKGHNVLSALELLKKEFGVKYSHNEHYPDLYCLNYDQINSPKLHPITKECRSLVLGVYGNTNKHGDYSEEFYIVSRSFDRFFNYGENGCDNDLDINRLIAYEKVDGSLISVFNHDGKWLYRTRKMIMPEEDMTINETKTTWKELIESVISSYHGLDENSTYIFELVSPENRVVTRYDKRDAYLLAARNNETGEYYRRVFLIAIAYESGWSLPQMYEFDTIHHCLESAKALRNLEEGYVMYSLCNAPVMKIKNPAYVAAHRLKGECSLTGKRIMDLIFMNEVDEYLSIFPEDSNLIKPYQNAYNKLIEQFNISWSMCMNIKNQKEFALQVKDLPYNGLLFTKKHNKELTFSELFDKLTTNAKYRLVGNFYEV